VDELRHSPGDVADIAPLLGGDPENKGIKNSLKYNKKKQFFMAHRILPGVSLNPRECGVCGREGLGEGGWGEDDMGTFDYMTYIII
jgi:hypothetical protein